MMKIENGAIIAGLSIGNIKLGMTKEELINIIGAEYKETKINETEITIKIENAEFWIASNNKIRQIAVWGDFQGKYRGIIGIGSTLGDVKKYIGNYDEEYDTYGIENEKGICFELGDMEEYSDYWSELEAPIEIICVFRK